MCESRWRARGCERTCQLRERESVWQRMHDRRRMSKKMISAPQGTTSTHLKHPKHLPNHPTSPRSDIASPRPSSSKGRGEQPQAATSSTPAAIQTCRGCQPAPRRLESSRRSCQAHSEEPRDKENSPDRPREEPVDPGSEPVAPGGVHDVQERPRNVRNKHVDGMDTPYRDTGPGWVLEVQGEPKVVKGNPDSEEVVDSAEYDWIGPSNDRNERVNETSALCRDRRPEGHLGEPEALNGIEGDWRCRNGVQGVGYARRRGSKDGAMSGTSHDSK